MKREDFSLGWQFSECRPGAEQPSAEAAFYPVDLPHDWQIRHAGELYRDGTGFYRKTFRCSPSPGQRIALWFEGAYMDTTVFVNGREAGQWKNGYTSFWLDITDFLQNHSNEVLVRCDVRHPNSRWYSGAGLYRQVELWYLPRLHLMPGGLYVSAKEGGHGRWQVLVSAEMGGMDSEVRETLRLRLLDGEGQLLDQCQVPWDQWNCLERSPWRTGTETALWQAEAAFTLDSPRLWDLHAPNFYYLQAVLGEDSLTTRFGCRTVEVTPDKGLFLNHRRVILHGVCMHHDLGCLGAAFEPDAARRQMEILREMGANSIRTGHTAPAPGLMDLADEMGFLIDSEIFDCWRRPKTPFDYARFFDQWQARDVAAWIRRDRNHPSLLFWSIGNEIYDTHAGPEGADTMRLLLEEVKEHDPRGNGIATFASNYLPWPNTRTCADLIKVVGYNYGERMYGEHHEAHPDWVIYGSETGSVVQSRGIYHFPLSQPLLADDDLQCSSLGNSRTSWGAESLDICLTSDAKYPFTLGQYLWSGFDFLGEPTPYHTRSSYFGMVDTAGFPKDAFYLCQAAWREQPMVHLFPYWDFNPGQTVDLCVCSNAHSVELFLNGESLGRKEIHKDQGHTAAWQAEYRPGEVRAVAYGEGGTVVAEDICRSFGDSAAVRIQADRTTLSGSGRELAFLTITTEDENGVPVANARDRITLRIRGAGMVVGMDNGDSTDPEEYQTDSRRLFSGKLLAVVAGTGEEGDLVVEATAPGLRPACITLHAAKFDGPPRRRLPPLPAFQDPLAVPVRKLTLFAERTWMDREHQTLLVQARCSPRDSAGQSIQWQLTDSRGAPVSNVTLTERENAVTLQALGDGEFWLRGLVRNGRKAPQIISQLPVRISGMGTMHTDPYDFVWAGRYTASGGEIGNGNERGIATSRTGRSWVLYSDLDFGPDGSDRVELPIFALDGEPTELRFWDGEPRAPGSKLLGRRIYQKPSIWNVYQAQTFQLDEPLKGVGSFAVELEKKVHIKGFRFFPRSRAFDPLWAGDCDSIYGDSFIREGRRILNIGNNVSLVFSRMDFGEEGCRGIRLKGRGDLPANTIHLLFASSRGTEEPRRRAVEFQFQPQWGEQTFSFEPVTGSCQVTFLFLPGTRFDFEQFRFL